jgi:general secretion pathway protein F
MPVFKYQGYKNDGTEIKGSIEADGHRDAVLKIKASGILPKEISEIPLTSKRFFFFQHPQDFLPDITRNISTLLYSGVPIVEAIEAAASEQKGQWKNILVNIKDKIISGATLSKSLEAYPHIFPEFYINMVSAGEKSGNLSDVLTILSDYLEKQRSLKNRVRTALIYPVFMALVSIFILSFLFTFVVPKIMTVFEGTRAALPFITVILIWISNFFQKYWWILLLFIGGGYTLFHWLKKNKRELIDALLLKMPLGITQSLYLARLSMTMSFLISGGVPVLNAMQSAAKATGNVILKNRIYQAQNLVSQGAKISSSLKDFPPTFIQMILTGEESGRLAETLKRSAMFYEEEFDRKLSRSVSLLEPCLILLMGIVVGFIVFAVLLPIFELNRLIKI